MKHLHDPKLKTLMWNPTELVGDYVLKLNSTLELTERGAVDSRSHGAMES